MIKLIVTDIDGTLDKEGTKELDFEYFEVIKKLTDHGVIFAAASGRNASSMKKLFIPVLDRMWFLSQNGGIIEHQGKTKVLNPIPGKWVKEFWKDMSELEGGYDCVANSASASYVPFLGTPMYDLLVNSYRYDVTVTGG